MDDWEVGKLPLWGRAGMPSELAPSYVGFRFPDPVGLELIVLVI